MCVGLCLCVCVCVGVVVISCSISNFYTTDVTEIKEGTGGKEQMINSKVNHINL